MLRLWRRALICKLGSMIIILGVLTKAYKKKNMILAKLKKMGYLKTESGKWIKRLSVEGHKHGCYFISKAFLNPTGEVDIVKLGKGGQS